MFLAFLAFVHPVWLLCLAFGIFLVPGLMESPRSHWELRAYKVSHAIASLRTGEADKGYAERISQIFTGPKYMWMSVSATRIYGELMASTNQVLAGEESDDPWLNEVVRMLLDPADE